jgi:AcrR family transcriptional regulator
VSTDRSVTELGQKRAATSGRGPWAGSPPHAEAARQRLLEAVVRCIERDGIAATTVAAIAGEAGVSRQTVYRYFEGRDDLVLRTILASAEEHRAKVDRHIRAFADPADMIVEALVFGLAELGNDPVLRALSDPSQLDASVTTRITGRAGIEWARETLAPAIVMAGWIEADADAAMEMILRMFLSLIISPSPERSPEELRAFLYRRLIPGLGLAAPEET